MSFTEGEDALLDLNLFEEKHNEFSSQFHGHALNSDDFVKRWKEIQGKQMHDADTWELDEIFETSMSGDQCEQNNGGKEVAVKGKRKRPLLSGQKRGMLAWERNVRNRNEQHVTWCIFWSRRVAPSFSILGSRNEENNCQ